MTGSLIYLNKTQEIQLQTYHPYEDLIYDGNDEKLFSFDGFGIDYLCLRDCSGPHLSIAFTPKPFGAGDTQFCHY